MRQIPPKLLTGNTSAAVVRAVVLRSTRMETFLHELQDTQLREYAFSRPAKPFNFCQLLIDVRW